MGKWYVWVWNTVLCVIDYAADVVSYVESA